MKPFPSGGRKDDGFLLFKFVLEQKDYCTLRNQLHLWSGTTDVNEFDAIQKKIPRKWELFDSRLVSGACCKGSCQIRSKIIQYFSGPIKAIRFSTKDYFSLASPEKSVILHFWTLGTMSVLSTFVTHRSNWTAAHYKWMICCIDVDWILIENNP